jgi:integrase
MRNPKGSVTIESHRGMLRLHLPRHLYDGQQKYLYLGLADTAINRQAAMAKKYAIEADIAFDRFDETLTKYTSKAKDDLPTLAELWAKYEAYKATVLAESTMIRDFPRVKNHISRLPSTKLKNARQIRNYLIKELTPASAKRVLLYLSACCKWAVEEELISNNPFENMPAVKVKKADSINPFTKAERDQIIAAFESH